MPGYTGSVPGNNPVPGKGKTSSPKGPKEQVISIKTAPKDAKGDQATVGKNGEILVPRSTGASRSPISAEISGDPREAETLAPKAAEESAPKAAEAGEEAKTAREKKGSKEDRNMLQIPPVRQGPRKVERAEAPRVGSGEGHGSWRFFLQLAGECRGEFLAARHPVGVQRDHGSGYTLPLPTTTSTTTDSQVDQGGNPTPTITLASLGPALQALLERSVSDAGVPGVILAVQTKDGVWIGAAGKAELDTDVPMTPDMQVRLGGVTKVFTAALIMKLVEENKIALTDTVEKWLPALTARDRAL